MANMNVITETDAAVTGTTSPVRHLFDEKVHFCTDKVFEVTALVAYLKTDNWQTESNSTFWESKEITALNEVDSHESSDNEPKIQNEGAGDNLKFPKSLSTSSLIDCNREAIGKNSVSFKSINVGAFVKQVMDEKFEEFDEKFKKQDEIIQATIAQFSKLFNQFEESSNAEWDKQCRDRNHREGVDKVLRDLKGQQQRVKYDPKK